MLPKINRIKKKKDFDLIFKKGKSFKTSLLVLKIMKNGLDKNRFGFIVSQKVSKKAVVRNRIRRRLTEMVKDNIKPETIAQDVVFIALPGIDKKDFLEIKSEVQKIIDKI
jgi:ribonuclease P protein component